MNHLSTPLGAHPKELRVRNHSRSLLVGTHIRTSIETNIKLNADEHLRQSLEGKKDNKWEATSWSGTSRPFPIWTVSLGPTASSINHRPRSEWRWATTSRS